MVRFLSDEQLGLVVGVADFEELDVVGDSDFVDVLLGASNFPENCPSFTMSNSKINRKKTNTLHTKSFSHVWIADNFDGCLCGIRRGVFLRMFYNPAAVFRLGEW